MKDIKWFFLFIFGFILTSIGLTAFYGWIATSSCTDVCNYTCGSSCYVNCYDFCSRHQNYSSLVSGIIFVILGSILIFITGPMLTRKLYIRESNEKDSNSNSNSNSNSTKTAFKEIFKKLFFHKQINDQEKVEEGLTEVVEVTNDTAVAAVTTTNTVESENLREQLIAQSVQIKALNERLEQIELLPRETSAQEVIELVESQTLENNENNNNNNDNNNNNNNNNDNDNNNNNG